MNRLIHDIKRSHRCGSLREADIGIEVVLMGWVHNRRDHGGCVFVDLRDREGVTQVVFDPEVDKEAHALSGDLRAEWVIGVVGKVRSRGGNVNPKIKTGAIEVAAVRLEVLAKAKPPPFPIEEEIDTSEETRLKYRFLDLRRPGLQRNLILRHQFNQVVRRTLDAEGFLELETPFLIKSTPEGARDYVVPSRVHGGKFFALPQSPQLFKQLFMVSGFDRYFQIARCFRDEDLRAERQPEFTQVDMEMSFISPADIQAVVEKILVEAWRALLGVELPTPFQRLSYDEAMARFGVDAPDLRFGLELNDLSDTVRAVGFKVFADTVAAGGVVKALNLHGTGDWSRKDLEELEEFVKPYGAKGLAWIKVKEDGSWQGPVAKFFKPEEQAAVAAKLSLAVGDTAVFVADRAKVAHAALGNLRKHVAKKRNLIPKGTFRFCWVTEFPLFEYDDETQRYFAAHHPFTAPQPEHVEAMVKDPGRVKAQAYDIVLNGIEIGGGSIRIHDSVLQQRMFEALGIGEAEAKAKFGFLLEALQFGAPPHGGLALGVDRIMMLICGTDSIRDVIAFPKTQKQTDLMLDAPARLDPAQLAELSIRVAGDKG
ncbi:MAG: aspartate--tRNA ligase [Deltaproteobacteria bacterium]|nr:aspartate--tRNA ligase [Deltaproteobacteria bacterium]